MENKFIEKLLKDKEEIESKLEDLKEYMLTDHFSENKDIVYVNVIDQYTAMLKYSESLRKQIEVFVPEELIIPTKEEVLKQQQEYETSK